MTRLDRYLLRQLLIAFGFFLLVFTGVVWLTQAVRLIDTVVASGRGGRILLEFSAFVLPDVLVIVLPLSGMGAALYTLNRLYSESELVVMMTAGVGPWTLLRPVAAFGALIAAMMAVTLTVLVPLGGAALATRTQELRSDLASALIVERQFLHPVNGLTLFIAHTDAAGSMSGVFLHDQRDPARPVTYAAQTALLLREGDEARLVMRDGVALAFDAKGKQLSAVEYDQFVFDLSDLVKTDEDRAPRPAEYGLRQLLSPTPEMLEKGRYELGHYIAEAHYKITLPLLAWLYPPVALVTLLAGGYRRSGFGRRVVVAVGVAVLMQSLSIVTRARVQDDAALWPAMYLPILVGLAYVGALLWRLSRPTGPARLRGAPA
ncbi:LPS export ABC transporter permease LptF [Amaricoccus sp.]|uniref:LPS export ABC transporter permease LptF n=1 Tax=Amaricoccus sp. TaxID=1872485 RepID=UPI001B483144|nr:LPS export ABC transporter permease LptF [Amaricoccus sp.]MBP7002845.1 LPS export ABC transporter permease LptF [Amaricoccus sp.]